MEESYIGRKFLVYIRHDLEYMEESYIGRKFLVYIPDHVEYMEESYIGRKFLVYIRHDLEYVWESYIGRKFLHNHRRFSIDLYRKDLYDTKHKYNSSCNPFYAFSKIDHLGFSFT